MHSRYKLFLCSLAVLGLATCELVQVEQFGMAQCPMTSTLTTNFFDRCMTKVCWDWCANFYAYGIIATGIARNSCIAPKCRVTALKKSWTTLWIWSVVRPAGWLITRLTAKAFTERRKSLPRNTFCARGNLNQTLGSEHTRFHALFSAFVINLCLQFIQLFCTSIT